MDFLEHLRGEIARPPAARCCRDALLAGGYRQHLGERAPLARAYALERLLTGAEPWIYEADLIAGSTRGLYRQAIPAAEDERARQLVESYGSRSFITNYDHFAPDYDRLVQEGVGARLARIDASLARYKDDPAKTLFLQAARRAFGAFQSMILGYARAAKAKGGRFAEMGADLGHLAAYRPVTFRQGLQLVWLAHLSFVHEGRYAMALGRLDQILYPLYRQDVAAGRLSYAQAVELLACTFLKIGEARWRGGDDVVNICIGGVTRQGADATNELSYAVLEAVGRCNIPGPNLSARIHSHTPERFLDACLRVIGTGLGYPALMNDEVNIPALARHGYRIEDCRDYCMVGCIENFLQGRQPPWSDGRFNAPLYLEAVWNRGRSLLDGAPIGVDTGDLEALDSMEKLLAAYQAQLEYGAAEYMARFTNENTRLNPIHYMDAYLSCFCRDCIERGMDIHNGGAQYPSVHGAGCEGSATVADSGAALEETVYRRREATLSQVAQALRENFQGHEALRQRLLAAPKYGNNLDAADQYAVWYVNTMEQLFAGYRTHDGGAIYTAMASNVQNISSGREVGATPDGRLAGEPLSDAASPMHGQDSQGPTAVALSLSKPDYTRVCCGSVVNQKFSPAMFESAEKRARLAALVRVYFGRGGQELQINAVSRELLMEAMEHPERYGSLVVRVSGFSAYFTTLDRAVQLDILKRTEHG